MSTRRSFRIYASVGVALVAGVACSDDPTPYTYTPPPPADASPVDASSADTSPPPPPDKTPPALVQRVPEAGDDNVWVGAPIRLVFSEPLASSSVVDAAITLQSEGDAIAKRTTLSEDGREISVVIESPHVGPAQLTVTVAGTITDMAGNAFAGTSWSFGVPRWQRPGGAVAASGTGPLRPALALDPGGYPVVAWQEGTAIRASRLSEGKWQQLGTEVASGAAVSRPRIAVTSLDEPLVAWQESADGSKVYVKRYRDGRWDVMGAGPINTGRDVAEPVLSIDEDDRPVIAWIEDKTRVEIRRWEGNAWQQFSLAWEGTVPVADLALALDGSGPVVAVASKGLTSTDVRVARWNPSEKAWVLLGLPLNRSIEHAATRPSIAVSRDGVVGVAWQENDGYSDNVYAAAYDEFEPAWHLWGKALDVEFDASAVAPSLGFARDGAPIVAWSEGQGAGARTYVGRFAAGRWEVPGAGLDPEGSASSQSAGLVVDAADNPVLVWETQGAAEAGAIADVQARRYNGGSALPYGIVERVPPPCSFPASDAPDFPRTLSETKCFSDVPGRVPAKGLIPYDVNSPLWSDGALKRRFMILPEGATIHFTEKYTWALPVGVILVKEFLIEREPGNPASIYPMETRFLLKRCESGLCRAAWEGYSYQWNEAGTEATLLANGNETFFKDWPSGASMHRHSYPGRDECRQCHANAAGGVLGLATDQMNRNFEYGGVVDNQLRALAHAGVFATNSSPDGGTPSDGAVSTDAGEPADGGSTDGETSGDGGIHGEAGMSTDGGAPPGNDFPFGTLALLPRLPTPGDAANSVTERMRSYFHSNCSHCHRPDGRWPVIDFLYTSPLIGENESNPNICNELIPGDAENSRLYIKDSTRLDNLPPDFFGLPMPPLASLIVDQRQLPILKRWIDEMKSCP
jgi:hypothetical protein